LALDVGCGPKSPLTKTVDKLKVELVGVDIFRPYLREANSSKTHEHLIMCEIRSLPFPSGSIDAVIALDTLEHLPPDGAKLLIKEMTRVARKKDCDIDP